MHRLMRTLLRLSFATSVAISMGGCTATESWPVQEVGPGTYSMGVPKGFGANASKAEEEMFRAIAKAGDFCHAKGQKLSKPELVGQSVSFQCVSAPAQ